MEVREVVLEACASNKKKLEKIKEQWYAVKFGDKEFLMSKNAMTEFQISKEAMRRSIPEKFYLYFDGDRVFTDDDCNLAVEGKKLKWRTLIFLHEDAKLLNSENFTLLAKEHGLALYMINNDNDLIVYKKDNRYIALDYSYIIVTFDIEKPLNKETYKLMKRLYYHHNKTKRIYLNGKKEFSGIEILDDKDVKVYTTENTDKHRIIVVKNAELVKICGKYIAIKGNKTYVIMDHLYYSPVDSDIIEIGKVKKEYKNKHRMFEYIIPDMIKVLRKEVCICSFGGTDRAIINIRPIVTFGERTIVEIPSLDSEIVVREWITKAEPINIDNTPGEYIYEEKYIDESGKTKLYIRRVKEPIKLDCKMLEPKIVEEKTYKIRDFIKKPVEIAADIDY